MVVKLKKPHTVRLGDGKNGSAALIFPANRTLLASETPEGCVCTVSVPCGTVTLELKVVLAKDNLEVVVK